MAKQLCLHRPYYRPSTRNHLSYFFITISPVMRKKIVSPIKLIDWFVLLAWQLEYVAKHKIYKMLKRHKVIIK